MSDFDLMCGRSWLLYFSSAAFLLAVLAGCLLWQLATERHGALGRR